MTSTATITDCFSFFTHEELCSVITESQLSSNRLKGLLNFIFDTYASMTLIQQSIESTSYAYIFAQAKKMVDVDSFLLWLNQQEPGWSMEEEILFSPRPSQLSSTEVEEALLSHLC